MLSVVFAQYVLPILGSAASSLLVYGLAKGAAHLKTRFESAAAKTLLTSIEGHVVAAIQATEQTVVKDLKEAGSWSADDKNKALETALKIVKNQLGSQLKKLGALGIQDVDFFLHTLIESQLQKSKASGAGLVVSLAPWLTSIAEKFAPKSSTQPAKG